MKTAAMLVASLIAVLCLLGCPSTDTTDDTTKVTTYGPNYLTYTGSSQPFSDVCREVLGELGYKEVIDANSVRYPYHAEGVSSHRRDDAPIAVEAYMQTRDEEGAEYKITTVRLGNHDPIVHLECSASDRFKLANALTAKLAERGIRVQSYQAK